MLDVQARLPFSSNFRWYKIDGMLLPSVTSILHEFTEESPSLVKWRERTPDWKEVMAHKAKVGTLVHNRVGEYFIDKFGVGGVPQKTEFEITDQIEIEAEACLSYFYDFIHKFKVEPVGVEIKSWHRKYKYAGTCDLVCKLNNIMTLIDWKTSYAIYEHYQSQVLAYKKSLMSDPEFKHDIKRCVVVLLNARNGLKVGEVVSEEKAWKGFMSPFDKFQSQYREPFERVEIGE